MEGGGVTCTLKCCFFTSCAPFHVIPFHSIKCLIYNTFINATYAVAKRKPEKVRLAGIRNPDLSDTGAAHQYRSWFVIYPGKMKMKYYEPT